MPDKHYVTVRAAIWKDGKLFIQKELSNNQQYHVWDLPGGRIDIGEDIHTGLKREVKEEIGVDLMNISPLPVMVYSVQGGDDGVVALIYSAEFVSESFRLDTLNEAEVLDTAYMTKEEYLQTEDFIHKPYIASLFEKFSTPPGSGGEGGGK